MSKSSTQKDSPLLKKINDLKDLLEIIPSPIFIANNNQEIVFMNKRAEQITGYKNEEVLNKKCGCFVEGICGSNSECGIFDKALLKPIMSRECKIKTKDGIIIEVLKNADVLVDVDGNNIGVIEGFEDISLQKTTEKHLLSVKKKLEESDRLKTSFLSNMSHEIRTPINSIHGFVQLLKEFGHDLSEEKIAHYYDIISKSSRQLITLIEDIVDVSKIESNQLDINLNNFSLYELLNDLKIIYEKEIENNQKNIQLEIENNDKDITFVGDRVRIQQILSNLFDNAIKFSIEGNIKLSYKIRKDNFIEFRVKDEGIGISEENFDSIFDRFSQIDYDISRKYQGAGMGLTISKGLVELMEGEIWVESIFNKGTCFYFTLPNNITDTNLKEDDLEKSNDYNCIDGKKILVVEDDFYNLMYIKELLGIYNPIIIDAGNGKEAIECCMTNPEIDIVIMDIQLPKINGYEATKQIKKTRPTLPIIAQTAFALHDEKKKCLAAGCDEYISKPIDADLLLTKIKKLIK